MKLIYEWLNKTTTKKKSFQNSNFNYTTHIRFESPPIITQFSNQKYLLKASLKLDRNPS